MSAAPRALGTWAQVGRVGRLLRAERRPYLIGSLFVGVSIGTALAYPQVIRLIIDEGVQGRDMTRLNHLSLIMVGILLLEAVATCARDYYFGLGAELVCLRLRRMVFETLLRQDVGFFDTVDTGQITARLSGDVGPLQWVFGEECADSLKSAVFCVCGTVLLFYTSPRLTLLTLLAVPPIAYATSRLGERVRALSGDLQQAHADAGAAATEVLSGIRTVRAFSQEGAERDRYEGQLRKALEQGRLKVEARAWLGGVSLVAGESAALLAIWVGGGLIVAGHMTTGALISFILYALFVARGLRNASRFVAETLRAIGSTQWAFDLLERVPALHTEDGRRPDDFDGSVVFERLRFSYPSRPDVEALKGVDLRIAPGEIVALVGTSGSGKSTLLNLMLRFYDPDDGRVLVGGHDVRVLDAPWLRRQIATVMQEPTLFSRSVAENIRYGLSEATDAMIREAAHLARADEFIDRLPEGYHTPVGDRGVQLSGGQRQRLAIARALLRRPKVLVLDEATSALDAGLESLVQSSLREIPDRPTTLVIAHRLSTVTAVDRVVVLDQGRIVDAGTHEELVQSSAFYRQLVHTQLVTP